LGLLVLDGRARPAVDMLVARRSPCVTMPAATVRLVMRSMSTKAPVTRLAA
jgi:hypothetical protein